MLAGLYRVLCCILEHVQIKLNYTLRDTMLNKKGYQWIIVAMAMALLVGIWQEPHLLKLSEVVAEIFMRLLKLISLPIISLSLLATLSSVGEQSHSRNGKRILTYTVITTMIAASIALSLYVLFQPVTTIVPTAGDVLVTQVSYWDELLKLVPSNIIQPFLEGNVVSIMLLSLLMGLGITQLPKAQREPIHQLLQSLFLVMMQVTRWIIKLMPVAIWAFMVSFVVAITEGLSVAQLGWYIVTVVAANIVQAVVILPLFLYGHGIKPMRAFTKMLPALSFAFFSKSSTAAIPAAIDCAETKMDVKPEVARFSFPLCTSINMNACAAFILITVLFVAESQGVSFTFYQKLSWIVIATVAAVGNAGVPMGCFFLASALLSTMNVPLTLMGIILPFYAMLDMLESAINVWSDSCVTLVVDHKAKQEIPEPVLEPEPKSVASDS